MKPIILAAAVLLAPALAAAQDLSGAWTVSSSVGTTPITVNCTLAQVGEALSGSCAPATGTAGPTAFTGGVVKAGHVSWGYDVSFRGQPAHVGFEADVTSDGSMKGVLMLAGKPSPFTAVKK
jgi:hypothetical protein